MTSADVHGKFLWHELMTTDPSAAGTFYSKVFGWKAQPWDQDPSYTLWMAAHGPAGGMMRSPGAGSPHWIAYVGVRDVSATVATVEQRGGRVQKGVTEMSTGAKYAVLADPQGSVFGVYSPSGDGSGAGAEEFTWHELGASDHAAAFRFYQDVFGWEQLGTHDMGGMGQYLLFGRGGQQLGGMYTLPSGMAGSGPRWLAYARSASVPKLAEATKSAGGRVLNGPQEVPGGSWIVQLADPQGAVIAGVEPPRAAAQASAPKSRRAAQPTATSSAAASGSSSPAAAPKGAGTAAPRAARKAPAPGAKRKAAAKKSATKGKRAAKRSPAGKQSKGPRTKGKKFAGRTASRSSGARKKRGAAKRSAAKRSKRAPAKRHR